MTKRGLIIALVGLVVSLMAYLMTQKPNAGMRAMPASMAGAEVAGPSAEAKPLPAPDITFAGQPGEAPKRLLDRKGKVVVLDFWATWCGPCRMSMPELVKIYDKYKDKGLEVYGVTTDEKTKANAVAAVKQQLGVTYPLIYIEDVKGKEEELSKFQTGSIPALFIVDKKGMVRDVEVGFDPTSGLSKADEKIGQLLAE